MGSINQAYDTPYRAYSGSLISRSMLRVDGDRIRIGKPDGQFVDSPEHGETLSLAMFQVHDYRHFEFIFVFG